MPVLRVSRLRRATIFTMTSSVYLLLALDMDGTLLNNKHEISEKSAEVLRKLADSGVIVSIATGRSSGSVTQYER